MKRTFTAVLLSALAISMVGCQTVGLTGNQAFAPHMNPTLRANTTQTTRAYMPGEVIVKFKKGASSTAIQSTMKTMGLTQFQSVGSPRMGVNLMKTASNANVENIVAQLRANPSVLYAEPNGIYHLPKYWAEPAQLSRQNDEPAYPNDEMFSQQYAHKVSNSQAGWEINKGSADVILSIVDTGVDTKHPDLSEKIVPGYDLVDKDNDPTDEQGHGTHCAGIAAAMTNNGVGVAGFAPNVKVMPVRVLNKYGSGTWADVAGGIAWAAENGAHIISMSLGGSSPSSAVEDAVKLALSKDVVVVAAMGNSGNNTKSYPAAIPGVIAVGATDNRDKIASFSQYGDWISISAPGVKILSTFPTYSTGMPGTNYGSISGTSMATPAAAGVAALIRSQFPDMNREQVRAQLEQGTDDLGAESFDIHYGHGRINVQKALTAANRRNQVQALNFRPLPRR